MRNQPHTHAKDCPDYKAAAADRAQRDAVMKESEHRLQVAAHAEWMGEHGQTRDDRVPTPTPVRRPR